MAFEDVDEHRSSGLDDREWYLVQNKDSSSVDLYGELQNTAEKFKKLADRLQKKASRKDLTNDKGVQTNGCCEETKTKLMEYMAENLRLRQSLKDVSDINHRWQDYNYDRQKHVQHLVSTVSDLRKTIDDMKLESRNSLPTPAKENGRNESADDDRSPPNLRMTIKVTSVQGEKTPIPPKGTEINEPDIQTSLNVKLSREVRVLSRQLKDARNESKALKQRLGKVVEENDILRTLLKSYKSDWKDENKKKTEALRQAQQVVQELCALRVNCQMQAEKLMKMSTVSFNCSLCQGNQNTQSLNNLNDIESEQKVNDEHRERHKKLIRTAKTIIQSIDGVEVHLQERCPGEPIGTKKTVGSSNETNSEKKSPDSPIPVVTFPDSDSDEQTILREPSVQQLTPSQHLICPVCATSFLREHGSQFLDHYTKCKLTTPGSPVS